MQQYIPLELQEHGIAAVHPRPFCAGEDSHILGRFDAETAWATFPKLELNPPHAYAAIILDIDDPREGSWVDGSHNASPSWLVVNTRAAAPGRRAGGIHAVYSIETPIARHDAARGLPLRFMAHVADRLAYHLGADPGYKGLITRNPLNPGPECYTHWGRMLPYTLQELDAKLPKGAPPPRRLTGIGRNCDLFRAMVSEVLRPRWAGVLGQGWAGAWLDHVRFQNAAMFPDAPLPDSECRSIAKSCARYWARNYDPGRFSDIQRARTGKQWHGDYSFDFDRQAEEIHRLKSWGLTQRTIAAVVGLTQGRVSQVLRTV